MTTKPIKEWKDIKEYEGIYQISNYGDIRSLPRSGRRQLRILNPGKDTDGYRQVVLHKNGQPETRKIHQLVLETFDSSNRPKGSVTRHLDGDRENNYTGNLQWGTVKENAQDAVKHQTSPGFKSFGSNNGYSKLTESDVVKIKLLLKKNTNQQQEIAFMFGVCKQTITHIKLGNTWKHIGG